MRDNGAYDSRYCCALLAEQCFGSRILLVYLVSNILTLSVGGYMWLRDCNCSWLGRGVATGRLVRSFSQRSLPIYFVHVQILELLAPTVIEMTGALPVISRPSRVLSTMIGTTAVIRGGESLPGLRLAFW